MSTENATGIFPFHCGSQYADWIEKNCAYCKRAWPMDDHGEPIGEATCDLEVAVAETYAGVGLTEVQAKRMGYDEAERHYCWPCGEVDSTTPEHAEAVRKWRERQMPEVSRV